MTYAGHDTPWAPSPTPYSSLAGYPSFFTGERRVITTHDDVDEGLETDVDDLLIYYDDLALEDQERADLLLNSYLSRTSWQWLQVTHMINMMEEHDVMDGVVDA